MFFNRGRNRPSLKQVSFRLTEVGKGKLQTFDGGEAGRVLMALEVAGSSLDLDDLSRQTGFSPGHLERLLPGMARKGYISMSGQGDEGGAFSE